MRPRKTILLVNANERQLGIERFMLEVRGYRVLAAHDAGAALALHAPGVDLVLMMAGNDRARGPQLDWRAMAQRMKACIPETPLVIVGERINCDEMAAADFVLTGMWFRTADVLERVQVMIRRKRGPRRAPRMELAPAAAGD